MFNTTDNVPGSGLSAPFKIGSDYHYPDYTTGAVAGEWTSFYVDRNDVPTIRDLLNGNPQDIQIGKEIWIQPGTKDTLFEDVNAIPNLVKSDGSGTTVYLPVCDIDSLDTHAKNPVKGFVPIKILHSVGKNEKYILAKFIKRAHAPWNNASGPCYGAISNPRMVK